MMPFLTRPQTKSQPRHVVAWAVVLGTLVLSGTSMTGRAQSRELVIGRVSTEPQRAVARMDKLARYLALHTADLGITEGRAIAVPNNAEMSRLLISGSVDVFSETVVSAAAFTDKGEAEVLLHEWRDQVPYYHSLFVIRKDGDVRGLADLINRKVGLDNVGSTTAYLLPMAMLRRAGLESVEIPTFNDSVPANKVGYVLSNRPINTASWIARGAVDAGAVSDIDMKSNVEIPEGIRKELRVLTTSMPLPRSLLLTRKNLNPTLKKRIAETLLAADDDAVGKAMMRDYFDVNRYAPFQGEVVDRFRDVRRFVGKSKP